MTVKTKNKKTTQEIKKKKTLDLKINTWSKYSLKSTPDEAGEQRMESVFPTKGRGKCPPPAEEMPPLLLLVHPSGLLSMTIICQSKVLRDKKPSHKVLHSKIAWVVHPILSLPSSSPERARSGFVLLSGIEQALVQEKKQNLRRFSRTEIRELPNDSPRTFIERIKP